MTAEHQVPNDTLEKMTPERAAHEIAGRFFGEGVRATELTVAILAATYVARDRALREAAALAKDYRLGETIIREAMGQRLSDIAIWATVSERISAAILERAARPHAPVDEDRSTAQVIAAALRVVEGITKEQREIMHDLRKRMPGSGGNHFVRHSRMLDLINALKPFQDGLNHG